MHFSSLFFPIAIASVVAASPIDLESNSPANLISRADAIGGLPTKSVKCGAKLPREQTFTAATIKAAAAHALELVDAKKQIGPNNYPHRYGYLDPEVKLAADCKRGDDLQEFPITRGKYTGGAVTDIPDRVVIKYTKKGKAIYCGLMTHEGAAAVPGVGAPFKSCSG